MRLVTFEPAPGCPRLGILVGDHVVDAALASAGCEPTARAGAPTLPDDMMELLNQGDAAVKTAERVAKWAAGKLKGARKEIVVAGQKVSYKKTDVRLLAPVPRPPKILCLALNYKAHAEEGNVNLPEKPYVFIKPGFAPVVGTGDKVIRPPQSQNFVFEGELAAVIGKRCRMVPKEKAYEVIVGYTNINDMSARDLGKVPTIPGLFDWFAAKAFDTSLPMGPALVMKDEIPNPDNLRLQVRVNGKTVQDETTQRMLFKLPETIEYITGLITLEPGDIICTGTPGGSKGALKAGDVVEVEIGDMGVLSSTIADRK
jgi:2-keto-4-pentenoate hydratase/2-oxohepta-3-ene-1,7-dioic acid hydratase in catechol pathway